MDTQTIFGFQLVLSFVVWGLIAKWLSVPWLDSKSPNNALLWLTLPHAVEG